MMPAYYFLILCLLASSSFADPIHHNSPPILHRQLIESVVQSGAELGSIVAVVPASDPDEGNSLVYLSRDIPSEYFLLEKGTGKVRLRKWMPESTFLFHISVYDNHGLSGGSATLRVSQQLRRKRRQLGSRLREDRVFVLRRVEDGELFSLAEGPNESFSSPNIPTYLNINSKTGMVSLNNSWPQIIYVPLFTVIITDLISGEDYRQEISIRLTDRTWSEPIFTNGPRPITIHVPMWTRPGTVIAKLVSVDSGVGADTYYKIESGAQNRFAIDSETGELMAVERQPFQKDMHYFLSVSAQNRGAAVRNDMRTPAQLIIIDTFSNLPPQLDEGLIVVTALEDRPTSDPVGRIAGRSHYNLPLKFTLTPDYPDDVPLRIDQSTGFVYSDRTLNYASLDRRHYRMSVTLEESRSDGSIASASSSVMIQLQDVNNHVPEFHPDVYITRDVREDVAIGSSVLKVSATDLDEGVNAHIQYDIKDESGNFAIDPDSGEITVKYDLDFDNLDHEVYEFVVTAIDSGEVRLSSNATVQVWPQNVNDMAPVFSPEEQYFYVQENAKLINGKPILLYQVQAHDPDGDSITFTHINPPSEFTSFFELKTNGNIYLKSNLEVKIGKIELRVQAEDDGSCCGNMGSRHSTETTITIDFLGSNKPPSFSKCTGYLPVLAEESLPGTPIIEVNATDDDSGSNGELSYRILDHPQPLFNLTPSDDGKGAIISNIIVFDREQPPKGSVFHHDEVKFPLLVEAVDNGIPQLRATCLVLIVISDINDNYPLFDMQQTNTPHLYKSASTGAVVHRVFAYDPDAGENGTLTYSLSDTSSCPSCFSIQEQTGFITKGSGIIPTTPFKITVSATDSGRPALTDDLELEFHPVDAEDRSPEWLSRIDSISILENFTSGEILPHRFVAEGYGGRDLSLSVPRVHLGDFTNQHLTFTDTDEGDPNTMQIVTRSLLNYEDVPWYFLSLRAAYSAQADDTPPGTDVRLNVTLVDLNDHWPEFHGIDANGQYQSARAEGTPDNVYVTTVFAIDLDGTSPNNKVSFSFEEDCEVCHLFAIDTQTGTITTNRTFDRSDGPDKYYLNVYATDMAAANPLSSSCTVVILITGGSLFPPYFEEPEQEEVEIDEDSPFNTTVAVLEAENPDETFNMPHYSIESSDPMIKNLFAVETFTGRIYTVGKPLVSRHGRLRLVCRVFNGDHSNSTVLHVSIRSRNYYPPIFESTLYVASNLSELDGNFPLIQVAAHDPENDTVTYSLTGVLMSPVRLSIDRSSGLVRVVNPLDRDYPFGYADWQVSINAADERGRVGYAILSVRPTDVNDNVPLLKTISISGSVPPQSKDDFWTLHGDDYDFGDNARISFELEEIPVDDNGVPIFSLGNLVNNDQSLHYRPSKPLARGREVRQRVVMQNPGSAYKSIDYVFMNVSGANLDEPTFLTKNMEIGMDEMLPVGSNVVELVVLDSDEGEHIRHEYILTSHDDDFYLDAMDFTRTGILKVKREIRYEPNKVMHVNAEVRSLGSTARGDICTITITVLDVNNHAPVITPSSMTSTLPEGPFTPTPIGPFTATDEDYSDNGRFTFHIDHALTDRRRLFKVQPTNDKGAEVWQVAELDRERQSYHLLHILAIDMGHPPLTGTAMLNITVSDINDNDPRFKGDYRPWVYPSTQIGDHVETIEADDDDTPENGPPFRIQEICVPENPACRDFTFSKNRRRRRQAGPDGSDILRIEANRAGYNREELGFPYYELPIRMSNTGSPGPRTATGTLTIRVVAPEDVTISGSRKEIRVFNYRRELADVYIGHVHIGPDDGDRSLNTYEFEGSHNGFRLEGHGDIYMEEGLSPSTHNLNVRVSREDGQSVVSTVSVMIRFIEDYHLKNAGSMRLAGLTPKEFVSRSSGTGTSMMERFEAWGASALNTNPSSFFVFSVEPSESESNSIDVRYIAHDSPWHRPSRMSGVAWFRKNELQQLLNRTVTTAPIDLCTTEICWEDGCFTELRASDEPSVVETNVTSLVAVNVTARPICACQSRDFRNIHPLDEQQFCSRESCANGGTCHESWGQIRCECPAGFDGPRCQQLRHRFGGNGWAWFDPLGQCRSGTTRFEFMTSQPNSLILYNGPMHGIQLERQDFMSLELVDGLPRLRVSLDGEEEVLLQFPGNAPLDALNDGAWHTLEIFKDDLEFRMVVDHCMNSVVDENLNISSENRENCEVSGLVPGDDFMLQVSTPLQLGGRRESLDYPTGLTTEKFQGCIKNLNHNGKIYDLHVGAVGLSVDTFDGCSSESCSSKCPPNSECIGVLGGGAYKCVCKAGWRGLNCDVATTVKQFMEPESFMEWKLFNDANETINSQPKRSTIHASFRTRDTDGTILQAGSFSNFERFLLQVVNSRLLLHFDVGAGDVEVSLHEVNASDGLWHDVAVERWGNQIVLQMDGGEGPNFNQSGPTEAHRLMRLGGDKISAGANVKHFDHNNQTAIDKRLETTCINDVRLNHRWLPMTGGEPSEIAAIVVDKATEGCSDGDPALCANLICPEPSSCFNYWNLAQCRCPDDLEQAGSSCIVPTSCSWNFCSRRGDCVVRSGEQKCYCSKESVGARCQTGAIAGPWKGQTVSLSTPAAIIIVCAIALMLLLLLLVILLKRKEDPSGLLVVDPTNDTRDNLGFYEEEGAGEEDQTVYDIRRLRKPIDADMESISKPPYNDYPRRTEMPYTSAQPMVPRRGMDLNFPLGVDGEPDIRPFIDDRLFDADNDPNAPPFDSIRYYIYDGNGSDAGSLSSLASSDSEDADFEYLNDLGPHFRPLADMYTTGEE